MSGSTLTPVSTATRTVLREIDVGWMILGGSVTPDGRMLYVINYGMCSVIPVRTATNTAGKAITLPGGPTAIAFFRR